MPCGIDRTREGALHHRWDARGNHAAYIDRVRQEDTPCKPSHRFLAAPFLLTGLQHDDAQIRAKVEPPSMQLAKCPRRDAAQSIARAKRDQPAHWVQRARAGQRAQAQLWWLRLAAWLCCRSAPPLLCRGRMR
jgi:hypothetical protein